MVLLSVISSGLLFLVPFFYPEVCFLHFFAYMPLMYASYCYPMRFSYGFLWGMIVFSAHLFWCLQMFINYNVTVLTVSLWIGTIAFLSLFSGIWFYMQHALQKFCTLKGISHDKSLCLSWVITTGLFIYFITYGALSIFGSVEGYPFFNPLFTLAQYPQLLWPTPYIGSAGYIFAMITLQALCVQGYATRSAAYLFAIFAILLVFFVGALLQREVPRGCMQGGVFITPWWFTSKEPIYSGYRMVAEVAQKVKDRNDVTFVCMPESTFNWDVYEYYQFVEMMGQDAPDVTIAFGGHRRETEQNRLKSSFFGFCNGHKVFEYDKRHLILFMERPCPLLSALGVALHGEEFFAPGDKDQSDVAEINGVAYQLFICSEFLVESKKTKGIPVLFVCNDAWLTSDYAKKWVELFIRFFEIRYNVPVLFGTVCGKTNIASNS